MENIIPGLLQDAAGAESILAAQDRDAFNRFHDRMRQRQRYPRCSVCMAATADALALYPGYAGPGESAGYLGLVTDCTGIANGILQRGSETGIAEHIELFDNPVFMAECGSRRVFAANAAAREMFGIDPKTKPVTLSDILAANTDAYMRDIYERLLFSCAWNGLLTLNNAQGQAIVCMSRVRAYDRDGHSLLWFSLVRANQPKMPPRSIPRPRLRQNSLMKISAAFCACCSTISPRGQHVGRKRGHAVADIHRRRTRGRHRRRQAV